MEANPLKTINTAELLKQLGKATLAIEIYTIVGCILCDDHNLLHTLRHKCLCLLKQLLHRHRGMLTSNTRNGTISASPITTLRDLQICIVLWCREFTRSGAAVILCTQRLDNSREISCSKVVIYLRNLGSQLIGIALREATDNKYSVDISRIFCCYCIQNSIDTLLLCIANKSAGVDYHHLGICSVAIKNYLISHLCKLRCDMLRIHTILSTAEGYNIYLLHITSQRELLQIRDGQKS